MRAKPRRWPRRRARWTSPSSGSSWPAAATRPTALDRIAGALQFPEWFGANFDALADSLGDLSWLPADGYVLLLEHTDDWRRADDDNFATLLDILNEAAVRWGDCGVPFWALLPLPEEQLSKLAF